MSFLEFRIIEDVDYVFIISGNHSIELPSRSNFRILFSENKNNDYGGYCDAIKSINNLSQYSHFFFINSSVRGPFLAKTSTQTKWIDYYLDLLTDDVGIVGSTINILSHGSVIHNIYQEKFSGNAPYSHVQSTAFCLNFKILHHLISNNFFNEESTLSKNEVVAKYELGLSQEIIKFGKNIKCLLPEYNALDYRLPHSDINPTSVEGDPSFVNAYFGRTMHPFETIFIKTNRGLFSGKYLDRLAYSMHSHMPKSAPSLRTKELSEYLARLDGIPRSCEHTNYQDIALTPNQIISAATQLIEQSPDFIPVMLRVIDNAEY